MRFKNTLIGILGVATLAVVPALEAAPLNVIFYGNSFTFGAGSTRSVNEVFADIATAAGHETPWARSAAASGQAIGWHVDNNTATIHFAIPLDQDWDYIVMQEHSTKLTQAFPGPPAYPASVEESKADVVDLYNEAKSRSADITPVLYETWARGPGHAFYTGGSPLYPGGPSEMQAEIRSGYNQLKGALDAEIGSDVTRIAPVGDAWEEANWVDLHSGDLWHAQNRGTLLAALVIYGTVYGDETTSDIDLTGVLASLSLDSTDGAELTAAADATLVPEPATAGLCLTLVAMGLARRRMK